jgi:enoyl-CoA hydratase/carnithine racemase
MSEYETIFTEDQGDVRLVTLNRPEKLNAWTPRMAEELADTIEDANGSGAIGSVVVTGAGRGFCAGADMEDTFAKRIAGEDPGADTASGQGGMPAGLDWVDLCRGSKPLIAAVNGACVGIGLTMILPFDVIIASDLARFGMGFIKVGLVPELASTRFLVQRVGPGKAAEFALSGDLWSARDALSAGLVERVVDAEEMLDETVQLAARIGANPAPQLLWTKHLLTVNAVETDLAAIQARESEVLRACWKSPEHKEAVLAFIEKRPAVFAPQEAAADSA